MTDVRANTGLMSIFSSDRRGSKMSKRPKQRVTLFRTSFLKDLTDSSEDHISGIDNFRNDGESVADKESTKNE